jgi:hypothetical protein
VFMLRPVGGRDPDSATVGANKTHITLMPGISNPGLQQINNLCYRAWLAGAANLQIIFLTVMDASDYYSFLYCEGKQ